MGIGEWGMGNAGFVGCACGGPVLRLLGRLFALRDWRWAGD